MRTEQTQAVDGSQVLAQLIQSVNGDGYSKEARVWNQAPEGVKTLLWNLAGLNSYQHNTKFKEEWLKLPNDVKALLRGAIHDLFKFLKDAERCLK